MPWLTPKVFVDGSLWSKSMTYGGKVLPQSMHGAFFISLIHWRISTRLLVVHRLEASRRVGA
jgi:hypothetical protein